MVLCSKAAPCADTPSARGNKNTGEESEAPDGAASGGAPVRKGRFIFQDAKLRLMTSIAPIMEAERK
jgi:hypothetical protein